MSNNTNINSRIDALEGRFDRLESLILRSLGEQAVETPARVVEAKAPKAGKGKKAKAAKPAPEGRYLTQKSRVDFIAAHDWAQPHTSTSALARAVVVDGMPLAKGWLVGEGYRTKFGEVVDTPAPVADAPKAKKAKKGKKAKREQVVVAALVADEPAYMSDEWIAKTHPREKDTPRDQHGRPTPKREWILRHALAETGRYDRAQLDAKVAELMAD